VLLENAREELDDNFLAMDPNFFEYSHHPFPHPHSATTGFDIGLDSSMAFHSLICEIPTIPLVLSVAFILIVHLTSTWFTKSWMGTDGNEELCWFYKRVMVALSFVFIAERLARVDWCLVCDITNSSCDEANCVWSWSLVFSACFNWRCIRSSSRSADTALSLEICVNETFHLVKQRRLAS